MRAAFPAVVTIYTEDYDNNVLVGGAEGLKGVRLRQRVADSPILAESLGILTFRAQPREAV